MDWYDEYMHVWDIQRHSRYNCGTHMSQQTLLRVTIHSWGRIKTSYSHPCPIQEQKTYGSIMPCHTSYDNGNICN
jgi:hypothetical protein